MYYSTVVKDGTLCSQYKDERDICILGECTVSMYMLDIVVRIMM